MKLLKKLSGSFLVGLVVMGLALSTSAFTAYKKEQNRFAGEVYVNTSSTGEYQMLPTSEPYDDNNCENTSPHTCSWVRTAEPGDVPEEFDSAEAKLLEEAGLIEKNSSKTGVYPILIN